MDKSISLSLDNPDKVALLGKALSSETRISILRLLCNYTLNINDIAEKLKIPPSSAAMNVKVLTEAGLIGTTLQPGVRGSAKICYKTIDSIELSLNTERGDEEDYDIISMPIGNYVDYKVEPTCGIVSEKSHIDQEDEPGCFYNPDRTKAKLIWFGNGYLEYRFPNHMLHQRGVRAIEISAEVCSEDHEYNMNYISDITLWVNGIEVGTYRCPSDYGGRRGKLNPEWWPDKNTQYGMLKKWTITDKSTFLDDKKTGNKGISQFGLDCGEFISVRIGIKDDARYKGGINLFGDCFGDYPQNILMKIIYE